MDCPAFTLNPPWTSLEVGVELHKIHLMDTKTSLQIAQRLDTNTIDS